MLKTSVLTSQRIAVRRPIAIGLLLVAALWALAAVKAPEALRPTIARAATTKINPGNIALSFVENLGQAHPSVRYESRGYGGTIALSTDSVLLTLPNSVDGKPIDPRTGAREHAVSVRMSFENSLSSVRLAPEAIGTARANYLLGNDESRWLRDLPTSTGIRYEGLYRGIDLSYDGQEGRLKGTFTVAPGVDPRVIRWHYDGVTDVTLAANGDLQLAVVTEDGQVKAGFLTEERPIAWQIIDGRKIDVECRYEIGERKTIGFAVGAYDARHPLVIDPTVVYRSFLGGNGTDHCIDCRVDDQGFLWVVSRTHSRAGFPGTAWPQANPLFPYGGEIADVGLSKISQDGQTLLFSTYIGGGNPLDLFGNGGADWGLAIDINSAGEVAITGFTEADNYPVTSNAAQPTKAGGETDAFVTILNSAGNGLYYSTYVGGQSGDFGFGIEWTDDRKLYLAGFTGSFDFPVSSGCFQPFYSGNYDGFLIKADFVTGASYSTYFGFSGNEQVLDLAVDAAGDIFICGTIDSSVDFSTLLAPNITVPQSTFGGEFDGFLAKIRPGGNGPADLLYATYLGGGSGDSAWGLDVDAQGRAYVCGITGSPEFPQTTPFFVFQGDSDAFVARIDAQGAGAADIQWSLLFGGIDHDRAFDVSVVGNEAFVCGLVTTPNSVDAVVARVLDFGFIVSGDLYGDLASFDMGLGIHANAVADRLGVCGYTASLTPFVFPTLSTFPVTPGAFQPVHGSGSGDGNVNMWVLSTF